MDQTNQSDSTKERAEENVQLAQTASTKLTLSSKDFNDPSDFSEQTRKKEIQSGDFFFFFALLLSQIMLRGFSR